MYHTTVYVRHLFIVVVVDGNESKTHTKQSSGGGVDYRRRIYARTNRAVVVYSKQYSLTVTCFEDKSSLRTYGVVVLPSPSILGAGYRVLCRDRCGNYSASIFVDKY